MKKLHIPHIFNKLQSYRRSVGHIIVVTAMMFVAFGLSAEPRTQKGITRPSEFTVVIDAGHGGHDHGAVDNGASEKNINLGVAKSLAAKIKKKMKDVRVVMTRDDDTFISLQERANIANRNKGNLFISIHTNSVDKSNPNRRSVAGASVYALGPQKDANNLQVAQRENSVIELEDNYHQKYSGFDPSRTESYIIFEMAQKKNLGQSLKFADKAQKELVATAGRKDRGVKQAGFWVLWATSMPSVLVELDFICNPEQAQYLDSTQGQEQLAEALFNAFESYVDGVRKPAADNAKAETAKAETAETPTPAVEEHQEATDGVNVLVASAPKTEKTRTTSTAERTGSRATTPARRRRSDSAKTVSDNRSFETESIELKSETGFLALQEKPEVVKEEKKEEPVADKNKKNKKKDKKKSEAKEVKDTKVKSAQPEKQLAQRTESAKSTPSHIKTFTVTSTNVSDRPATSAALQNAQQSSQQTSQPTAQPTQMVYKIQLLASDTERSNDDPAFCGLIPSGMFRENGKYKYTYGGSTNRREIEQKLMDIQSIIPDATIIVRME